MRRKISGITALILAVALVAVLPRFGFTQVGAALWSERPVTTTAPAPAASPWVELARTLKPAVVNISTKRVDKSNQSFEQFFGGRPRRAVRSLGSGFVINPNGLIVTNNHVVDGATEIKVTLADGRELPGRVLGRDPKTDIALLKVDATGLLVIPLGDSSRLQVGEPVMAIGNPFGLEQTVTTGIVSATGRVIGEGPYDDFIQTDASINPGNSGGPLINAQGQAVGINAAIVSQSGGSVGIGFAIPVNLAKPVLTQLAASGHVVRGYLGVTIQRVTSDLAKSFALPDAHAPGPDRQARRAGGAASRRGRWQACAGRRRADRDVPARPGARPAGDGGRARARRRGWRSRRECRAPARRRDRGDRSAAREERGRPRAGARAPQARRARAALRAPERRRPLHRRGGLKDELGHVEERARLGVSPTRRPRGHLRGARGYSGPAASPDARTAQRGARALVQRHPAHRPCGGGEPPGRRGDRRRDRAP